MPELPEVETIARGLANAIAGKTIAGADVLLAKMAVGDGVRPFGESLAGDRVTGVSRRGKYAIVELASGRFLTIHLRMTGRLIVQPPEAGELYPYTHVVIRFTDGSRLCFADSRQFGRMVLRAAEEPWATDVGIEPLSEDFTTERFVGMLDGRKTPIKQMLLDQRRIAGIGNIYACEALWEARIRPARPSYKISRPARARLHAALRDVLCRAIEMRGTSVDDYVDADGMRGGFQNHLSVYGREGEACERCGGSIVRTVLGQRGTWWCRNCQR